MFGGVLVFAGVHVWIAHTATKEQRAAWIANLEELGARKPAVVVPGHMTPDAATNLFVVEHTRAYLAAFDEELATAKGSVALIAAMKARLLGLGMEVALDIGPRVAPGERKGG